MHWTKVLFRVLLCMVGIAALNHFSATAANAADLIAGDLDHDGDVDADDTLRFINCFSGPNAPHNGSDVCDEADLDHDADVDLSDYGVIQACISGPSIAADPNCGGCVWPHANRSVGVTTNPIHANESTYVTVASSQVGVNYQLRKSPDNTLVGSPAPGTGGLVALPTGSLLATTTFNMLAINAARGCSVQLNGTATVAIIPGLSGTITNINNGAAVIGATVSIVGIASMTTTATGAYRFDNLDAGMYSLSVGVPGFNTLNDTVSVPGGSEVIRNYQITPWDTQAPTAPASLTALAPDFSKVNLAWTASTDNAVVALYEVRRSGTVIGTSTTNSYSDTGVISGTSYTYDVRARDAVPNYSAWSNTASVNVPLSPYRNKIGVHVVIGPRNGFGPFLQQCADANKPVALVKCVDDFGAAYDAKQYSPQTLTIGRKNDLNSCSWGSNCDLQGFDAVVERGTSPTVHAQRVFADLKPIWDANPKIDVWEICNEWSWWWAWQADFYIAMMDICEATTPPAGHPPYRIALYGCSGGNPPQAYWADIARACARAKAHGDHILSLHEYAWDGLLQQEYAAHGDDIVLRYRRLYNYLKTMNADCPLALTEVGENGGGGFVGSALFVNDFGWYDTQLRQDTYVLGCEAWTLGNWSGANFQNALPALTEYIVTH